jgi:hypothetical protein
MDGNLALPTPQASYLTDDQLAKLESDTNSFCSSAAEKRRQFESRWMLARRMVSGDQWLSEAKSPTGPAGLNEVSLPGRMQKWKITANRLLPGVDTRLAHVLKNKPIGVVVPETQDEEDRNAARIADEVVEYDLRTLDYQRMMAERAGPELFVTGNVFFHWYWDPLAGPDIEQVKYRQDEFGQPIMVPVEIPDPVTGAMVPNPDPGAGKPIEESRKTIPRGEPGLAVVEPEELFCEPGAKSLDDCQMVVHSTLKPLPDTKRLLEMAGVDPEKIEGVKPMKDTPWGADVAAAAKAAGLSSSDIASRCEVRVIWAKPNADRGFPKGLRGVMVNRQIMFAEPTPEGSDHIPFVHLMERPVAGQFYATSSVIQAMPLQKALNLTISRDEYRRTVQRPKLLADHEAGVEEGSVTNDDSDIVFKNAGYLVEWMAAPTYESDPRASERYIQMIDDLFGNVAILSGESDGEVRSGRQAFIQGEYAGTALSGPARSIERAVSAIGGGLLKLRKKNTDESRDIQIVGRNRAVEVLAFRGSDLDGAGDYYVEPGSALPMSMAQKKQMILELVDRMILAPDRALKMLPMPSDLDGEMDPFRLDRDRATEENMAFSVLTEAQVAEANAQVQESLLMQGPPPPAPVSMPGAPPVPTAPQQDALLELLKALKLEPRPDFEHNPTHIEQHNKFRKSRKYRDLSPAVQAVVDEHCDKHLPPPMPAMPGPEGAKGGGNAPPPGFNGSPQGLAPGMPDKFSDAGSKADVMGDIGANLPPMPPTPSSSNG